MRKSLNKIKRFNDYIHQLTRELDVITKKITSLDGEFSSLIQQRDRLSNDIEVMSASRDSSTAFIEKASFDYSLKLSEDLLTVMGRINTLDKRKRLLIRTRRSVCLKIITLKKIVKKYITKTQRLSDKFESREIEDMSNFRSYKDFC